MANKKLTANGVAPLLLNEHEVAQCIGMSVASLRRWRFQKKGPQFIKFGAAVRYSRQDVEQWIAAHRTGGEEQVI